MNNSFSVCNPPSDLDNGQVVVIDSGYRAEYTCDLGLSLDGVSERRCGADGSGWSDSDPVCGIVFRIIEILNDWNFE